MAQKSHSPYFIKDYFRKADSLKTNLEWREAGNTETRILIVDDEEIIFF